MPIGCLLDEPWPDDPTVKRREEEASDAGRLKSVNVSRLLWVSQLNGALEPGVNAHGDMGEYKCMQLCRVIYETFQHQ